MHFEHTFDDECVSLQKFVQNTLFPVCTYPYITRSFCKNRDHTIHISKYLLLLKCQFAGNLVCLRYSQTDQATLSR